MTGKAELSEKYDFSTDDYVINSRSPIRRLDSLLLDFVNTATDFTEVPVSQSNMDFAIQKRLSLAVFFCVMVLTF